MMLSTTPASSARPIPQVVTGPPIAWPPSLREVAQYNFPSAARTATPRSVGMHALRCISLCPPAWSLYRHSSPRFRTLRAFTSNVSSSSACRAPWRFCCHDSLAQCPPRRTSETNQNRQVASNVELFARNMMFGPPDAPTAPGCQIATLHISCKQLHIRREGRVANARNTGISGVLSHMLFSANIFVAV